MADEAKPKTFLGPLKFFQKSSPQSNAQGILDTFNDFLKLYDNKLRLARDIYRRIGEPLEKLAPELKALRDLNNSIIRVLGRFFLKGKTQIAESKFQFRNIMDADLIISISRQPPERQKELMAKLQVDFQQGIEYMNIILQLILKENEKLNNRNLLTDNDLRLAFSQLLISEINSERNAKIIMIRMLRTLKLILQEENKERNELQLKKLRIIEIPAAGRDLKELFDLTIQTFPPDEMDPYSVFKKSLTFNYTRRARRGTAHIMVAKKDRETVGGTLFDYVNASKFSFAIIWWDLVKAEYRRSEERIGSGLYAAIVNRVRAQQSIFNKPLYGIVAELNDPSKMSKAAIKADVMDPYKRIEFWRRLGLKKVFHEYIQMTTDPSVLTNDCSLFVLPLNSRWGTGLPAEDLREIIYWLQVYSNEYSPKFLETYEPYQRMMKVINSKPFFHYS